MYPIVGRSLVPSQSPWLSAIISSLGSLNLRFFKRLQKAVKPARKPGAFEKPHRLRTQKCPGRSPVVLGTLVQVEAPHTVGLLTFGSAFPSFHWPLCPFLANGSVERWQFRREPREKNTKVVCCPVRDALARHLGRYKSLWQTHTWCRGVRSSEGTRKHPYLCCRLRTGSEPGGGRANLGNWSKSRCYISIVCLFFFFKPRLCSCLELAISNHPAGPRLPVCRGERGKHSI